MRRSSLSRLVFVSLGLALMIVGACMPPTPGGTSRGRDASTEPPVGGAGGGAGGTAGMTGGTAGSGGSGGGTGGSGGGYGGSGGGGAGGSGGRGSPDAGRADVRPPDAGSAPNMGTPDAGGGVAPEGGAAAGPKLSTDVAPLVKMRCALAGCHDPIKREHGMDLSTAANIFTAWVNKPTADHCRNNMAVVRVTPTKPEASFVVTLITAPPGRCAEQRRMPPVPLPVLAPAEVAIIRDWVLAGALNN